MTDADDKEPRFARRGRPRSALGKDRALGVEIRAVRLQELTLAALQHAVRELEGLVDAPRRRRPALVEPHGVHVADLTCGVAAPGQLQLVAAVAREDQPRRRERLRLRVQKRVLDGHGLLAARGVTGDDVLRPVREVENERRKGLVSLHRRVIDEVFQRDLAALVPERLHRKIARFRVRARPCAGRHAGPAQDVAALLSTHRGAARGRDREVGIVRVHRVAVRKVGAELRNERSDPARERDGQHRRREVRAVCQQPDDIHKVPLHRQTVVASLPAVGVLVEDAHALILHRTVRKPHADVGLHALPLLDALEQPGLAPRLEAPREVVHLECAGAVGQRQAAHVALLFAVKGCDDVLRPLLVHARQDLHHAYPARGKAPFGHGHADGVGRLHGKSLKGDRARRVAGDGLGKKGLPDAQDLHGEVLSHALELVGREIDRECLQHADVGKRDRRPCGGSKAAVRAGELRVRDAHVLAHLIVVREDVEGAVQKPAVLLQRRVAGRRKAVVVELRGLRPGREAVRAAAGELHVRVDDVDHGLEQHAPRVAGDGGEIRRRGLNHAASPPAA